jgi:hypothetical protein
LSYLLLFTILAPALHLISLDVPYPPDYGGMVDVFYKIKNLHEVGVKIYLHCFDYGRGEQPALLPYCEKVFYYKRKTGLAGLSLKLPYMLYSRRDEALLKNLITIEAPILFEGVHSTYYMAHPALQDRLKLLRNQNVEQDYFALLAQREPNFLKKCYYKIEAALLRKAENNLQAADIFLTVAAHDHDFFKQKYPDHQHDYMPSFQPYNSIQGFVGIGNYALYHGNLGHPENIEAAVYLLKEVCTVINYPFVFAGKNPHPSIVELAAQLPHCKVIANPDMEHMDTLIAEAQVHVMPTFQPTGLKLKLLHALFNGRHVVVNADMVVGTGLESICSVAESAQGFVSFIEQIKTQPFDEATKAQRANLLLARYNNKANALRLKHYLQ